MDALSLHFKPKPLALAWVAFKLGEKYAFSPNMSLRLSKDRRVKLQPQPPISAQSDHCIFEMETYPFRLAAT